MKVLKGLWIMVLALSFVTAAQAATEGESTAQVGMSNRMNKKIGVSIGVVGDPFPSILGVNGSYNVTDFARAKLGYGEIAIFNNTITTVAGGVTGFMPGWSLTPTVGLHYSSVTVEGEIDVQGVSETGGLLYSALGFDWQAKNGFNVAAGYNLPLSGKATSGAVYAAAGWFFGFLN